MRMPHCSRVCWWVFLDSSGSGDGGSLGGLANFKMPRQAASKQRNIDEFVSTVLYKRIVNCLLCYSSFIANPEKYF